MLLDTSMATMTVPAHRPTGSEASGPATAIASTATPATAEPEPERPAAAAPGARPRPRPGRRPRGGAAAPAADDQPGGQQQRRGPAAAAERPASRRTDARAHARLRWVSATTPPACRPDRCRCRPGAAARRPAACRPEFRVPLVDPVAEPGPEPRIAGVDQHLLTGLGVLDHDQADLGEGVVGGVDHPQRDHLVAVRQPHQRSLPVAGADEVGDHHDQAAPGQRGDGVEHRGQVGGGRRPGVGSALELPADPQGLVAPGAGRTMRTDAGVVEHRPDPVAAAAEQPGQEQGQLGQHVVLAAARAADRHGGRRSSTSQAVSSRSSLNSRTCSSSSRAVTFQSMCRASSPSTYGRSPAKSRPRPRCGVR